VIDALCRLVRRLDRFFDRWRANPIEPKRRRIMRLLVERDRLVDP
jgi:hypothetical protein